MTAYETTSGRSACVAAERDGSRSTARPHRSVARFRAAHRRDRAGLRAVGNDFNIGSTKQLGDVPFELASGGKKGKTGATAPRPILEELAPLRGAGHVLEWRQLSKLKSTMPMVGRRNRPRQRARAPLARSPSPRRTVLVEQPQPTPIRTEEGRRIRRAFIAEPGHLLLSADYSQIELRLAADVADA
jgi:DNA polymerase-1